MLETILFVLAGLYIVKVLIFYTGARRASHILDSEERPFVSVVVAARNEEKNIERCLEALAKISYPVEKREIILMNDQSTDATGEIIKRWLDRIPGLRYLETDGQVHSLRGKANAVAQAIDQAGGEIILTSDADCAVTPDWVTNTVRQYTPDTGCVCGYTLIDVDGPFAGMQANDWAYLLTIASAGVGWNYPLSAVGNNMSFRRAAYDDVGGYESVGFSVTEDFALFKAISYRSDWKVQYPVHPGAVVWSKPCASFRELYHQKKRWGRGGVEIPKLGFGIMTIGWLMSVALLALPFFGASMLAWGGAFLAKCAADTFLLSIPFTRFRLWKWYKYFPLYELYYLIYVTALPFVVFLTGKVHWKGRKL